MSRETNSLQRMLTSSKEKTENAIDDSKLKKSQPTINNPRVPIFKPPEALPK